jgi:flavin reductase (DIM6/NTAB) family NADH-FMN oxidoreductase RutF
LTPDISGGLWAAFATGVTVILAHADDETRGMTANAFTSGSLDPPLC